MTTLYTLHKISYSPNTFSAEIRFDPSHPVFAGHFPGQPLVPGVFLVEIVCAAASQLLKKQVKVIEASNLKFVHAINPDENNPVMLNGSIIAQDPEIFIVDATFRQDEVLFAKMKGIKVMSAEF